MEVNNPITDQNTDDGVRAPVAMRAAIRVLSLFYREALLGVSGVSDLSGFRNSPIMQFNFGDSKRQGTGDAPYMRDGLTDELGTEEGAEDIVDEDGGEEATYPSVDYIGNHPPSDINTGVEDLHTVNDFPSSAPYYAMSQLEKLRGRIKD
jgi:hypothetical protein